MRLRAITDPIQRDASRRALRDTSRRVLPSTVRHGSGRGYDLGCRCDDCTDASSQRARVDRARRRGDVEPWVPKGRNHGTISCYVHDKCRCDECKRAARDKRAKQRAAKRALEDRSNADTQQCGFCGETILWGWYGAGFARHEKACSERRAA